MKIKNPLDKTEKAILIIGILLLLILIGLGFFYSSNKKVEPYVSNYSEDKVADQTNEEVVLKQKSFTIQRNGSLDNDPAEFFDGSVESLKQIELDLDDVNISKEGSYKATAKFKDTNYKFTIVVEESQNPTLIAENTSFKYLVGPYSTIEEVIEIAGVTATDIDGNDITEDIVGWPEALPTTYEETTYKLNVTDMYGNVGYINITVDYQRVVS
ncbi:hypothetical protein WKT02_07380 [Erysipelotrichaceae bacterium HCN-30851]